jgi:hypothetical protein
MDRQRPGSPLKKMLRQWQNGSATFVLILEQAVADSVDEASYFSLVEKILQLIMPSLSSTVLSNKVKETWLQATGGSKINYGDCVRGIDGSRWAGYLGKMLQLQENGECFVDFMHGARKETSSARPQDANNLGGQYVKSGDLELVIQRSMTKKEFLSHIQEVNTHTSHSHAHRVTEGAYL